jgi:pyruvate dehydrogenase E1 component
MYGPRSEDIFYYIALHNENYTMPPLPDREGIADEIVRGLYKWQDAPEAGLRATLLFSGSAHAAVRHAAEELFAHYGVGCELWSATSYKALREDGLAAERWNRLHPDAHQRTPVVAELLQNAAGPIVATTDFMKIVPEQVSRFIPGKQFVPLGTDGMGRSDTREALRRHFEVDTAHIVVATLAALAKEGTVEASLVKDALSRYGIDSDTPDPYLL